MCRHHLVPLKVHLAAGVHAVGHDQPVLVAASAQLVDTVEAPAGHVLVGSEEDELAPIPTSFRDTRRHPSRCDVERLARQLRDQANFSSKRTKKIGSTAR